MGADKLSITAPKRTLTNAVRPRVGDARSPKLVWVLAGLACLTFVGVLYITSYMNFFFDEWEFVSFDRAWNVNLFLLPHNEHWSTIPILVWKLLFIGFGLRSHIPYEAALLAAHVAAVFLLFTLIRGRSGDLPAFAAALTLLVLGSGGTNIVWAFQLGFVGSVAFGLLAMLLLDRNRRFPGHVLPASAALLCSLMCSAVGLAFVVAIGAELFFDRDRRRFLLALVAPLAAFGEWFLAYGAGVPGSPGAPCETCAPSGFSADTRSGQIGLSYFVSLARFVVAGLQASAAGIFGLTVLGAAVLLVLAALSAVHWYRQRRLESWQIGLTAGVVAWFTLTSLGRAQYGATAAGESRYVYVGIVFLLPLVADAASELSWRPLWRPVLMAVLALALVGNIVQLRDRALFDPIPARSDPRSQIEIMRIQTAQLQTAEVFRGAPDMELRRSLDESIMPQLSAGPYFAAIDELGSPVPAATVSTLRELPPNAVDRVMLNLFGGAATISADSNRSILGLSCQNVDSTSGSTIDLQVANGKWIRLQSSKGGDASFVLSFVGPPTAEPLRRVQFSPATPEWVYLPNTGKPILWRLRIKAAPMGLLEVCGATSLQVVQATYRAKAAAGKLDSGWSSVPDATASMGRAAKATKGSYSSYRSDLFGGPFVPIPGGYDVRYRVKVGDAAASTGGMVLGMWDVHTQTWAFGPTSYRASQFKTEYS